MTETPLWRKQIRPVLLFWLFLAGIETLQYYGGSVVRGEDHTWADALFYSVWRYSLWALLTPLVLWLAERFPLERGVLRSLAVHLPLGTAVTLLHLTLWAALWQPLYGGERGWTMGTTIVRFYLNSFAISFSAYWLIVAVANAYGYLVRFREKSLAEADLRVSLAEAQKAALRYKLQPHFFFNTLQAIDDLVQAGEGHRASDAIAAFARLYRQALREEQGLIPLAEELDLARRYMDIQRLRFGDRLRIRARVDPDALTAAVPPLILQPLLENAITHGVEAQPKTQIVTVQASVQAETLRLSVINAGGPGEASPGNGAAPSPEGTGLRTTRERLHAFFGDQASFTLRQDHDFVEARVCLPLRDTAGVNGPAPASAGTSP